MDPPCFTLMKLMENVCASIDILILPSAKLIELRKKMNFKLVNILSFIVVLARYKKQFSFFSFLNLFFAWSGFCGMVLCTIAANFGENEKIFILVGFFSAVSFQFFN